MIEQTKKALYIIKLEKVENHILSLEKEIEKNYFDSCETFSSGLIPNKELIKKNDSLGIKINKAVTDLRYYSMLINEIKTDYHILN